MAGFWELPSPDQLPAARIGKTLCQFRHTITHHYFTFTVKAAVASLRRAPGGFQWFDPEQLTDVPLSTTARKALQLSLKPAAAVPH
jgi:adenine-specific DNA glycosylase